MLIIFKKNQKDYYDGVVGTTGIDKSIVYERKIIEIDDRSQIPKPFYFDIRTKDNNIRKLCNVNINTKQKKFQKFSPFFIGFCGKIYVGWKLYSTGKSRIDYFRPTINTHFTYDANVIADLIKIHDKKTNERKTVFRDLVKSVENMDLVELFRKYKTPCFVYDPDNKRTEIDGHNKQRFFVNPILKDYQFYKVFDAFQTLQEIQMFIGGVLGTNERETVTIADKYKIQKHGFDKWSFRKMSEKKK